MSEPSWWDNSLEAIEFMQQQVARWQAEGTLPARYASLLSAYYFDLAKQYRDAQAQNQPLPGEIILPILDPVIGTGPMAQAIWLREFACLEVQRQEQAGRIGVFEAQDCLADMRERVVLLKRKVARERVSQSRQAKEIPELTAVPAKPAKLAAPPVPRRNILEILLDPRSIQWLLGSGGALMVVGLVILLWVNKFFTPERLAIALGLANAGLLALGWLVIKRTRYQVAGKALTLLACLVMPLNLWYYHSNSLMTVDGHLWVAGMVICGLYLASALALRDEMFVYIFSAGVTLTGLLVLADLPCSPQRFWEIALPASMLVCLGLLGIHAERAFPEAEGPFSRKRFGLAFFWSGHVVMAGGLLLLLGAHIAGDWLYAGFFKQFYDGFNASQPEIVTQPWGRWLSLALVAAGAYAYVYSDLVVRRVGLYVHIAAGLLLWAEVLIVQLLGLQLGIDAIIAVLAVTMLVVNIGQTALAQDERFARSPRAFGVVLGLAPALLGVLVYLSAISSDFRGVWEKQRPEWTYVGAMLLTAVCCRIAAYLQRDAEPWVPASYLFAYAASTMLTVLAVLVSLGLTRWETHAPIMMLLPIIYLAFARLYRGGPLEWPIVAVANAAAGIMLFSSLASSAVAFLPASGPLAPARQASGEMLHLLLALFFVEAAIFFGLTAAWRGQPAAIHLATLMASAAFWQVLTYFHVEAEYYTLAFALVGLALLVGGRFAMLAQLTVGPRARAALQSANTLMALALLASALMGLSRLAADTVRWQSAGLMILLGVMAIIAAGIVRDPAWRRWYVVATLIQGGLAFITLERLSTLTAWQKAELFSVAAGLLILIVSHIGWYREQERQDDMVSLGLFLGSVLAGLPLAIATLIDRSKGNFEGFFILNEFGFLSISLVLLITGLLFQIRSTTLTGAALTSVYFVSLLIFVPWNRINAVALFILIGGSVIFGLGVLLSVYRERLLTLPERIKHREGMFRVLDWR